MELLPLDVISVKILGHHAWFLGKEAITRSHWFGDTQEVGRLELSLPGGTPVWDFSCNKTIICINSHLLSSFTPQYGL
jgi:hypothetical protein